MDSNQIFTSVNKLTKTNVRVSGSTKQNHIVIENIDVDIDEVILWFDFNLKKFTVESMTKNYEPIIYNIYQYQGTGTPTEFIAEDSTEHDYYTKQETNELLNKKQNINDNNLQTVAKQIVPAINENKSNIDKKQDKLTLIKEDTTYKVLQYKELGTGLFTGDLDMPPTIFIKKWINESISLDNYYTKPEVDEKLKNKVDSSQFKFAFMTNALGTENPNLETTNKTIVGGMNELLDKKQDKLENSSDTILSDNRILVLDNVGNSVPTKIISTNKYPELITNDKTISGAINELLDKKQEKENWTIIGKSISNREYGNFQLDFYKLYRTYITWEKPPFNQVNTKIKVEFKTGGFLGGYNDTFFLTIGKIDNEEVTLSLKVINHNYSLIMTGGNQKYGNIFSLEELQNTVKVNIIKPFKINSKSLKTNEIEENNWDIELKENPTTHCPCPKWKEVGTKININHIKYDFKPNNKYKIYYNFESQTSIKKHCFICKEFLYGELNTDIQSLYWDNVNNRIMVSLQLQNNTIYTISNSGRLRYGQLLKLEELQG